MSANEDYHNLLHKWDTSNDDDERADIADMIADWMEEHGAEWESASWRMWAQGHRENIQIDKKSKS